MSETEYDVIDVVSFWNSNSNSLLHHNDVEILILISNLNLLYLGGMCNNYVLSQGVVKIDGWVSPTGTVVEFQSDPTNLKGFLLNK